VELNKLGPGACFGEMAVINQMPRSATIVAPWSRCSFLPSPVPFYGCPIRGSV
jgi:hypothetical protein